MQTGCIAGSVIVATNVNDILHRALTSGDYSQGTVTPTAAPSMDIQVSSNFERLLFDLNGRDGQALAAQMGKSFKSQTVQVAMITKELTHGYSDTLKVLRSATSATTDISDGVTITGTNSD